MISYIKISTLRLKTALYTDLFSEISITYVGQTQTSRQQQAKPVIDKIKKWLDKSLPHVPPKTALGKALQYLHHQWPRLIGYLDDGRYPIDNNPAENAIRPFAIGRKNWLLSHSQAGAKASANLYSLIETAQANDINPYAYLKHVFKELPNANSLEHIEPLLPWLYQTIQ